MTRKQKLHLNGCSFCDAAAGHACVSFLHPPKANLTPSLTESHEANQTVFLGLKKYNQGFPSCSMVKNPPANAGNTSSIPGPGRFHTPQGRLSP